MTGKTVICMLMIIQLSGCSGHHAIFKKDTEELNRQIDSTLQATHAFYRKLEQQKINFLIDFMASHPACTIEPDLHILLTEYRCLSKQEIQQLARCRNNSKPQTQCQTLSTTVSFPLIPGKNRSRHTTISLLGLVTSYQHALSKVLIDRTYDISPELKIIRRGLQALGKQTLNSTTPASLANRPAKSDKPLQAVNALSNMMVNTHTQQQRFKDVQTLVIEKGPAIEQALQDILDTYVNSDRNISILYELQLIQKSRQEYNRLSLSQRLAMGTQQRKLIIRRYYQQAREQYRQEQQVDAISLGLRELINSQKQLRAGFKGTLTNSQRQRIAGENQAQLKAMLKSIFDIVKYIS